MRVTLFNQFEFAKYNMNLIQEKTIKEQYQIATGKQYETISEDPIRANQAMVVNDSIGRLDQYLKNIEDAGDLLMMTETAIGNAVDLVRDMREEGLKASNDTFSQSDKDNISKAIEQGINQLVSISNRQFLGKYIFSGQRTNVETYAYDGTSATYQGASNVTSIKTTPYKMESVGLKGDDVFQGAFDALIQLRDEVQSGTATTINSRIALLDDAMEVMVSAQSQMGTKLQGLDDLTEAYGAERVNLEAKRVAIEEVDFTKVMMEHANTQRMYQAVLMSTQSINQMTLMNFM